MADKDTQAQFMEALNGLKEYAKVNGGIVTREDVNSYFKDMSIDDAKFGMITGYLMANNIKIAGEDDSDNAFLKMMEEAAVEESSEENVDETAAKAISDSVDYSEDDKYLKMYLEDLKNIVELSEVSRAFLLVNIVEDNDKESLKLLSESYLSKIVNWIEDYRNKGVLACDLVQEGNLAMMAYISEKRFLNNYEWKDKLKEGSSEDVIWVMAEIDKAVKLEVDETIKMLLEEQKDNNMVSGKILNKVNLVNDWAIRIKEELGRKPTIKEVAEKMGVAESVVEEAIALSAEGIEDISYEKSIEKK